MDLTRSLSLQFGVDCCSFVVDQLIVWTDWSDWCRITDTQLPRRSVRPWINWLDYPRPDWIDRIDPGVVGLDGLPRCADCGCPGLIGLVWIGLDQSDYCLIGWLVWVIGWSRLIRPVDWIQIGVQIVIRLVLVDCWLLDNWRIRSRSFWILIWSDRVSGVVGVELTDSQTLSDYPGAVGWTQLSPDPGRSRSRSFNQPDGWLD